MLTTGDHPRSRGVYWRRWPTGTQGPGSSPLARGLLVDREHYSSYIRIIPARAGFTVPSDPHGIHGQDHPRSRGVYHIRRDRARPSPGSSPLARGLRHNVTVRPDGVRIIPARAGFTRYPPEARRGRRDHPRSRGVYGDVADFNDFAHGSSPLARGLRQPGQVASRDARIIPARAGFTGRGADLL